MDKNFWKNKKVLITGNTGFKGAWLTKILINAGADVYGYALECNNEKNIFYAAGLDNSMETMYADICDEVSLFEYINRIKPEIVFHLAAQPIVRVSYNEPLYTYRTNVMGTATLLECIRKTCGVRVVVNITTDKVYQNNDENKAFKEDDRLCGYDPYSNSKSCSELVTASYVSSFFNPEDYNKHKTAIATARAGNVIGGGDFSCDRLIPDCIRAVYKNEPVVLRNPLSVRPWQNVLEPLAAYIMLAEKLYTEGTKFAGAWNIGPRKEDCVCVEKVIDIIKEFFPKMKVEKLQPDNTQPHEASLLILNSDKLKNKLEFINKWDIYKAVKYTALWYKQQMDNQNMIEVTDNIISEYFE